MDIRGVIYDLDGTLISTGTLNEQAWLYAGKKFEIPISREMLLNQRSIPSREGALLMLPPEKQHLLTTFIEAKEDYINTHLKKIHLLPYVVSTITLLKKQGYLVWVCTSAPKEFVKSIVNLFPIFSHLGEDIIWREAYLEPKPSPQPLLLTLKKMKLNPSQVYYVGDGINDYNTSLNAKVPFIYFMPDRELEDLRIPQGVPRMTSHKQIVDFLEVRMNVWLDLFFAYRLPLFLEGIIKKWRER